MAVKIKLTRLGKIRNPQYRVIIADARTRREGRAIETIGRYHPKEEPSLIEINSDRAQYWLGVGAQPTDPVLNLLKITGDWQKFKGLPGQEGTLRKAEPKPSKLDLFNQALAEAENGALPEATTPKTKRTKKAAAEEVVVEETTETSAETVVESAEEIPAEAEVVAEAEEIVDEAAAEIAEETAAEGE